MTFRQACMDDLPRLAAFYRRVIDATPGMAQHARWVYGLHPTDDMLRRYIQQQAMYLLEARHDLMAAAALTMSQGEDYHSVDWSQSLADDEVAVVHLLCVAPDAQGQGVGRRMVQACIRLAGENGRKAIRLDALASNTPAHRLYGSLGFRLRGRETLYADNTGWTDFLFFELPMG